MLRGRSPEAVSPLSKASGTSLHRQLFIVLRDEISRGIYAQKGALPKEESLCERFGVSRITVRRALADLAAQGIVERRHGLGTFVREGIELRRAPSLSVVDELRQVAAQTSVEVLEVLAAEPPADIAALLQLPAGGRAVRAVRLRRAEGVPVMLTDAWVPGTLSRGVTTSALRKRALFEILIAQGLKFGRVVQEITAQPADPARAKLLETDVGAPLLKMTRLMHDQKAQPVLHLVVYLAPERSRILMDIPGSSVNTMSAGQIVHDVRPPAATRAVRKSNEP
jgi:GntR family transcriptional regulator